MSPLAITMGDPAGIGPEIIAKAFQEAPQLTQGSFVVGDVASMRRAAGQIGGQGLRLPVAHIESPSDALNIPPRCLPVLQVGSPTTLVTMGQVSAQAGRLAGESVVWAARAALRGEVAAIVTAPLHKEALALAGGAYAGFPGHTELLQRVCADHHNLPLTQLPVRMMLANDELRVVLVSIHLALREALRAVTTENILQTLVITHDALHRSLGRLPRIAVAGLNPHAGEGGLFGREEIEQIEPAIAAAQRLGIQVRGPYPPDTVFMRARSPLGKASEFDVVIAMYHDQGLIPVKYLGVEQGVNVTLGLPIVRTSPDHGTAFDIAGTGQADPSSLLAAIRVARDFVLTR